MEEGQLISLDLPNVHFFPYLVEKGVWQLMYSHRGHKIVSNPWKSDGIFHPHMQHRGLVWDYYYSLWIGVLFESMNLDKAYCPIRRENIFFFEFARRNKRHIGWCHEERLPKCVFLIFCGET